MSYVTNVVLLKSASGAKRLKRKANDGEERNQLVK